MARPLTPLASPPIQNISVEGAVSTSWSGWFDQVWKKIKGPIISTQTGSEDLQTGITFFPNEGSLVVYRLPEFANIGELVTVVGVGSGGWRITQNTGQSIHSTAGNTTVTTGTLSSTNRYNAVVLICTVKDTQFSILGNTGTLTFT